MTLRTVASRCRGSAPAYSSFQLTTRLDRPALLQIGTDTVDRGRQTPETQPLTSALSFLLMTPYCISPCGFRPFFAEVQRSIQGSCGAPTLHLTNSAAFSKLNCPATREPGETKNSTEGSGNQPPPSLEKNKRSHITLGPVEHTRVDRQSMVGTTLPTRS